MQKAQDQDQDQEQKSPKQNVMRFSVAVFDEGLKVLKAEGFDTRAMRQGLENAAAEALKSRTEHDILVIDDQGIRPIVIPSPIPRLAIEDMRLLVADGTKNKLVVTAAAVAMLDAERHKTPTTPDPEGTVLRPVHPSTDSLGPNRKARRKAERRNSGRYRTYVETEHQQMLRNQAAEAKRQKKLKKDRQKQRIRNRK